METEVKRLRITVHGMVQGVGFRPWVYRQARALDLCGRVQNLNEGVMIDIEGAATMVASFLYQLKTSPPVLSRIQSMQTKQMPFKGESDFVIQSSDQSHALATMVMPDMATCSDCLKDIFDSSNRRYAYPFTNCTQCGPRYSIIQALPYDRVRTTMKGFTMCVDCQQEYDDPYDRRFHAQPNACPQCGPQLSCWDDQGRVWHQREEALKAAVSALRDGQIVAVKGLGGFQLMVDARSTSAVQRLRQCKQRPAKPLAVMFPDVSVVETVCTMSAAERACLSSPQAPIMLLLKNQSFNLPEVLAPHNPYLGCFLPYTPLHHLLLKQAGFPVVATSGNMIDEPICIDNQEALQRLKGMADVWLVHDRPIQRPLDDSVGQMILGEYMMLRRARGYAPLPLMVQDLPLGVLSVGGHLKNTVTLSTPTGLVTSTHIGDLSTSQAYQFFKQSIQDLSQLNAQSITSVISDGHPDYLSSQWARDSGYPYQTVQHHHAHVAAVMAEHHLEEEVLGIVWDGTGDGCDGTIWGGEFLQVSRETYKRRGSLRLFRLPGGDKAVTESYRSAVGLLQAMETEASKLWPTLSCWAAAPRGALPVLYQMMDQGIQSPWTSSMGRLFDAVASLLGLVQVSHFEGDAAMRLQFAAQSITQLVEAYPFQWNSPKEDEQDCSRLDWEPMIRMMIQDIQEDTPVSIIAARFHQTLVDGAVAYAKQCGISRVVLSGGCFQNQRLATQLIQSLRKIGFKVFYPHMYPPNDGALSLGQAIQG